jgi:glutathione-regulated potassium-efflux system ancillary protein KefC
METNHWLHLSLIFFVSAVLLVPAAQALGLGPIIGYLVAGMAIGPSGMGWVTNAQTTLDVAEFGVVLMLFMVGLELEPKRLWSLRVPIFVWGNVQLLACAGAITAAALLAGAPWRVALVTGLGLALSSTAVALQVLQARNLMPTRSGQAGFAILLLQDVAAIPILALLPLLGRPDDDPGNPWVEAAQALAVVIAIVVGGRLFLRHGLRWAARSRTPEIFTAAALGVVVSIAALMDQVGLSMALGAFIGGVLLAESEFKRALEADVEPFKGLLLGLFFMAVGMSIDFAVLLEHPWLVAGIVVGFLALKIVMLALITRAMDLPHEDRPTLVLLLAQGGEFAFVVFQQAVGSRVLSAGAQSMLVGAVALSMVLTPLLLKLADRWLQRRRARSAGTSTLPLPAESADAPLPTDAPVILCGFGRYGQIVGRLLYASGMKVTVLDHDADQVEVVQRFGFKVYFGDSTRLDLLRVAGAAQARVVVVAVDDIEQSLKIIDTVQEHFPQARLVVRARNLQHYYALRLRGVDHIERETFESALASGRSVLECLDVHPMRARQLAQRFRRFNLQLLEETWPHHQDADRLVALSRQGSQQLAEQFAQDRLQRRERRQGAWGSSSDPSE